MADVESIPTGEIKQDIAETEAEIVTMEREITAFRLLGDRMSHFKADARVDGIRKRREFIAKLADILRDRELGGSAPAGKEE
jgi:hypothetical protein